MLQLQGFDASPNYIYELKSVLLMYLFNTLTLLFFFQAFIIYMALKKKKWAIKYYKGYTISAAILTFLELTFSLTSFDPWHITLLITGAAYAFGYREIKRIVEL
jgi:hypothetical protein